MSDLRFDKPVQCYECDNPCELHIDIKKLERLGKVGHPTIGDRTQRARNIDWNFVFMTVDE